MDVCLAAVQVQVMAAAMLPWPTAIACGTLFCEMEQMIHDLLYLEVQSELQDRALSMICL